MDTETVKWMDTAGQIIELPVKRYENLGRKRVLFYFKGQWEQSTVLEERYGLVLL